MTKVGEEEKEEKEEKEKEKLGDSMPRHFQRKWPRQKIKLFVGKRLKGN